MNQYFIDDGDNFDVVIICMTIAALETKLIVKHFTKTVSNACLLSFIIGTTINIKNVLKFRSFLSFLNEFNVIFLFKHFERREYGRRYDFI